MASIQGATNLIYDGELYYLEQFITHQDARKLYDSLMDEVELEADQVKLFGRLMTTKRLTSWHGETGLTYTYSGMTKQPKPWSKTLLNIKSTVETTLNTSFNSCLVNYYPDGQAANGYHSDDEKDLIPEGVIASLSLGAQRRFLFKHKQNKELRKMDLHDGSLLIMAGDIQQHWKHALPKSKKINTPRLNLTFRQIIEIGQNLSSDHHDRRQ